MYSAVANSYRAQAGTYAHHRKLSLIIYRYAYIKAVGLMRLWSMVFMELVHYEFMRDVIH